MQPVTIQQAFELALQHHRAGRLPDAEALYRQILAVQPNHAGALHFLGVAAHQTGRHDLAVEWIRQALVFDPRNPAAYSNLGEACRALGRLDDAVAAYRAALQLQPGFPEAHNNLGAALIKQEHFEEAAAAFRRAIELKPDYAEAHNNLGNALTGLGRLDEAVAAYQHALAIKGDLAEAHNSLGNARRSLGQPHEATAAFRSALALRPDYPEAQSNLGVALAEQGQLAEAAAAFQCALELLPDFADAKFDQAMLRLLLGDFDRGWPGYEARWDVFRSARRHFSQPRWDGGPIDGRRVLIHAEQGFGDSIQFIRYAALIAARGGEIILECHRPLVELLRGAKGVREVVATGDPLPSFDLHVPMLSQPMVFQTRRESIPQEIPYLFADPVRREAWQQRLGRDRARRRVGLAWAGSPQNRRSQIRNISPEMLLPLWRGEGVDFFSLQVGPGAGAVPQLPGAPAIIDLTEHLNDFADTAALMAELDLIVSVDTAAAHLAGALGRPVWTLLPFIPDWRWGVEGESTPWYSTMRLFRQPAPGDWPSVIRRVSAELAPRLTPQAPVDAAGSG